LIYNFPEQIFTDAGVVSIEHADFDGIERLAAVTGYVLSMIKIIFIHIT
jgi:T-complex protein 1 subunit beta